NALEALSKGGTLTVATERLDDTVNISVTDTGPGIPPEVGRRLFEQFFTTKPQGTGLGLSITRQIVEEHAGRIHWASTPGAGTTLPISLPIKRPVQGCPRRSCRDTAGRGRRSRRARKPRAHARARRLLRRACARWAERPRSSQGGEHRPGPVGSEDA